VIGFLVRRIVQAAVVVLPALTLVLVTMALFSRYMRSAVLDNITQDYMRTARARRPRTVRSYRG